MGCIISKSNSVDEVVDKVVSEFQTYERGMLHLNKKFGTGRNSSKIDLLKYYMEVYTNILNDKDSKDNNNEYITDECIVIAIMLSNMCIIYQELSGSVYCVNVSKYKEYL